MTQTTLGRSLCAIGLHKWKYKFQGWMDLPKEENERGCMRCRLMQHRRYGFWMKDVVETLFHRGWI